jgi:transcriptional regulator with XRE-family HTH domain
VTDDLTSDTRLGEGGYSYIPQPAADLPFFDLAAAMDPRLLIAHEGVPGHYFQMALSATNPDPIRRRYIDSGANEGIGFYVEEMLLQAGLFTFSPQSRELVYQFMRLRALREAAGLSQRDLAARLGIHHSNIGYWERSGQPPRSDLLASMADALGVSIDQVLGRTTRRTHAVAPNGRSRLAFQAVSRLPKRQQQKIVEVVEALVAQHAVNA